MGSFPLIFFQLDKFGQHPNSVFQTVTEDLLVSSDIILADPTQY